MTEHSELHRTATHEASHAVMAWLLGATAEAGPVSIEPGTAYLGVCFFGRARLPTDADMSGLARPYPLLPARLRTFYESVTCVLLAGRIGEEMYGPARGGELWPPAGQSRELSPLPVRERAILAEAAASDVRESDMSKSMQILGALHFDDDRLAQRHLGFLSAETEAILGTRKAGLLVAALADSLMTSRTLSASGWKSILRDAA